MVKKRMVIATSMLTLALCMTVPLIASAESIDDLSFRTENYPPYNLNKRGKATGMSVDLLLLMAKRLHANMGRDDVKIGPWARGYQMAVERKNACIFSTTRTPEREHKFKWIGPIASTTVALIAKKDKQIHINTIDDIHKYRVGVVIKDIGEQLLEAQGIKLASLDRMGGENVVAQSFKKLYKGRIDLFAYEYRVAKWTANTMGLKADAVENVYTLKQGELYYACNKQTSDTLIAKLQQALDALKKEGAYQKVVDQYQ